MPATQRVPPVSGVPARQRFYLRRCVLGHGRDERWRFHRLGIRTEVIAIIALAAALPGCIFGQRPSAGGAPRHSMMHRILRNLAGSQTLAPTGWFLGNLGFDGTLVGRVVGCAVAV